jgi:hypothetical protein
MPATRVDPYRGFNFLVEIDGISQAGFQECSGLDASTDTVDYREGSDPNHVRKLTGLLWKWRQTVIDGKPERKNGSVVLLDETGAEKLRWNFVNAWPSKWTGPSFNSTGNSVAVETLELTHEEVKKA